MLTQPSREARRPLPRSGEPLPPSPAPEGSQNIRQAMSCLASASRRLQKGEGAQADEVLTLLRAATAHLQQALEPETPGVPGPPLVGAE
jgi:hypothetical protein